MDRKLNINHQNTTDFLWDISCKKTVCPVQGMLSNSFTPLVGGFSNNNYWSSSENNANNAWKQNFNNGNQNNNNKNNNNYVRCIRPFNQNKETLVWREEQLTFDFCIPKVKSQGQTFPEGHRVLLSELFNAYYECRKNKRNTANALRFEIDYEKNLVELHKEINSGTYLPGRSIAFIVNKPVKREIFAADFRDRIVHHFVISKINPYFEKYFIHDSYSCRLGKGTHYGIKRVNRFIRAATDNYKNNAWILKLDIEAFFMNINKDILYGKLCSFIETNYTQPDKPLIIELCKKIIYNDCRKNCKLKGSRKNWNGLPATKSLFNKPPHKGIPIGNLTSQVFANFYLTPMDHFIKHTLGIRYYGRYVDDFILVHTDKEYLKECNEKIKDFLQSELDLNLHPSKKYLQHFAKGVSFIGCFIKPGRIYINKRTKNNFSKAIEKHNEMIRTNCKANTNELKHVSFSINSYLGILKQYNTYKLRKSMLFGKLSAYFFNYFYISGNYGKIVFKIRRAKHKHNFL